MAIPFANRNQYQGLFSQNITLKATLTIPSVATAASNVITVTVQGAAIGDLVDLLPQFDLSQLNVNAYVSSANTVSIRSTNISGGTVNLGAQVFYILISRPNPSLFN